MHPITLLAMAPSGETFFARDHGRVWLFQPVVEPEEVDPSLVGKAVAYGGFDVVERDFDTWDDVERFLNDRASLVLERYAKDPADLDAKAIGRIVAVARRWIDDGQPHRARQTVLALLKLPAALEDPAVHASLVALLEGLSRAPAHLRSQPTTDAQRAARHRWEEIAA